MFKLLQTLCEVSAPSGCENPLAELIKKEISPYVDTVETDALGNLIAHKKGKGKKLMLCAHMDEVGLVATCFGEKGQVYVSPLGGLSPIAALYQRVVFAGGVQGVLVPDGKEEVLKDPKFSKMYVDIGAKDDKEAAEKIAIGEAAVFVGDYLEQGDVIVSKAMDDRAGCFALISAISQMKTWENDLYFVFTASEELGLRGAKAAAVSVAPDYAVAIDVTRTGDVSSAGKMAVSLDKGVAVKVMDHSFIAHPEVKNRMISLCEAEKIPSQHEVLERGGTDAGAIHLTGGGVPSGCVSIPTRYIHSPGEMIAKEDLLGAVKLILVLIEKGI